MPPSEHYLQQIEPNDRSTAPYFDFLAENPAFRDAAQGCAKHLALFSYLSRPHVSQRSPRERVGLFFASTVRYPPARSSVDRSVNTRDKVITLAEWLRTLDELLGALRKAQSTDDVRAICVHSRSITELLCQAALDHRNVSPQGTELRALLQTLRSKAFGLVLSDDLDHALNTLQAEGNFGAHPKTSDPDRMQQASRRVVEELPKVLRWFHSTIAEREPSQLVSEFLADPFKRAATASPGATRLDDLQQPIVISQGDTRVPVARNAVIATLFALVTVLSSGRLQGWFSRTLRNSHIPHRTTQSDGGCVVPAVVEVHLRPSPTCYSIGKLYPGSELVNVLEMSPLTRWGRNLCRVRTTSDQREGWFFVHRAELELACPGRWPRTSTSDVDCRLPPLNNGLCEDSMAFVNGVCVDRTLVTVNEYQSCVDVGECSVRVTTAL